MSEHGVTVSWRRRREAFSYEEYDREHTWSFDGGVTVEASAAQEFLGKPGYVDPEAAYAAALSSCHMLTFLAIAARRKLVVDSYDDEATAYLEKNPEGKLAVPRVTLRPRVTFGGERVPSPEEVEKLHHTAHAGCFLANSVKSEIAVEPRE
jgi:organic hydroperoxide reductase OsmC/OhrA